MFANLSGCEVFVMTGVIHTNRTARPGFDKLAGQSFNLPLKLPCLKVAVVSAEVSPSRAV